MASNGLTGAIDAGGKKVDYVAVAAAESAPLILIDQPDSAAAMLRKPVASDNSIAHLHPQESKWI